MEVAGYEFSTCAHAAQVQTYLPYYNQETIKGNRIGEILEIPVTLSAQEVSHLEDPLSSTVFRLSNIEQFGGVATISIKPNLDKVNIEYEKQLINHYIDDAWFTTVKGYGEWWKARSMIELDVETTEDFTYVNLYAPKLINDLPLLLPLEWQYIGSQPQGIEMKGHAQGILITELEGRLKLAFKTQSNK